MKKNSKCKVLCICSFKGGVGKTTTAIDLSAAFVKLGKKVVAIDSDGQGHLTMDSFLRKNNLKLMNGVIWMIGDIKSSDAEYLLDELIPYEVEGYFDIQCMDVEGMPESVHMIVECQTGINLIR